MRSDLARELRAVARASVKRAPRGKATRRHELMMRLGWLAPDPARPGCLALTVAGARELVHLPPRL